jgi:Methylamine utilisation protein MauE
MRLEGLCAAFGLMILFTFYIAAIMTFSKELPCACGGVLSMLHWKGHLVFNIVFVGLAAMGIELMKRDRSETAPGL